MKILSNQNILLRQNFHQNIAFIYILHTFCYQDLLERMKVVEIEMLKTLDNVITEGAVT